MRDWEENQVRRVGSVLIVAIVALAAAIVPAAATAAGKGKKDTARYILPPGNYGGLPFSEHSTDQLPLYSGLTPLRDNVTKSDINDLFLPEDFAPIGDAHEEDTGEPGVKLIYDAYGIPHVYGKTRYDVAFGAGWSTARDRQLLLTLGRGPARAAVADVPNLDAFSLVTSGQSFVPSDEAEALVTKQRHLLVKKYGKKGKQIVSDASAYADGINAYMEANGIDQPPANANDVIAVTAFIGSIFGAGGGGEAANADLLANLQQELGQQQGYDAWDDVMLADDPEAPTTLEAPFRLRAADRRQGQGLGRRRSGLDRERGSDRPRQRRRSRSGPAAGLELVVASRQRSASNNALAVMGPQLGYYYPEIVQQIDLHGPGIKAQGAAVPGLAMYILIGRTQNYAWSLTSAGHDVRDVFAEELCDPGGGTPTRDSDHYLYKGECRAFKPFTAGTLNGTPVTYDTSVHGSVFATATIDGKPYALSRERSTFGRDALNLAALHDMTMGKASTPKRFFKTANEFGFTFNWGYTSRNKTAYFSSGLLPERARGLDRRLPTLGTGDYEWKGFLSRDEHPHGVGGPGGLLLNWNNRSAPGFMHGDDEPYGSVQRVEMFDQWPKRAPDHRQRRDHEPSRDRGRALARLAGGQQGPARRPGAERARPAGRRSARRLGRAATLRASTPTGTAPTTRPVRRSWTTPGDRSPRR